MTAAPFVFQKYKKVCQEATTVGRPSPSGSTPPETPSIGLGQSQIPLSLPIATGESDSDRFLQEYMRQLQELQGVARETGAVQYGVRRPSMINMENGASDTAGVAASTGAAHQSTVGTDVTNGLLGPDVADTKSDATESHHSNPGSVLFNNRRRILKLLSQLRINIDKVPSFCQCECCKGLPITQLLQGEQEIFRLCQQDFSDSDAQFGDRSTSGPGWESRETFPRVLVLTG